MMNFSPNTPAKTIGLPALATSKDVKAQISDRLKANGERSSKPPEYGVCTRPP